MREETVGAAEAKSEPPRARRWLSKGLESLWANQPDSPDASVIDVLIIGSGYGGAVAAVELAGRKKADGNTLRVCVLERGSEYLSGMFPARVSDLAGHVRFSTPGAPVAAGMRTGLFDLKVGPDVNALVANGLGGGSLINAGVMLKPHDSVFQEARWPREIRSAASETEAWAARFTAAQNMLGASPVAAVPAPYKKIEVMESLGKGAPKSVPTSRTPITVALAGGHSPGGVAMSACIGCGDCFSGCNHGAKLSLDVSLLVKAQQSGAEIYTGATVLKLLRGDTTKDIWQVQVLHTDPQLRRREGAPLVLKASTVILSAGSFGSTEILLRSESSSAAGAELFSSKLGAQFSTNGDMIEAGYELNESVNCVANESEAPDARHVGPTITTMIDNRTGNPKTDLVVQDLSVPGPLRRLFEEGYTLSKVMDDLASADKKDYQTFDTPLDDCAVDRKAIRQTLVVALIERDAADGILRWSPGPEDIAADGAVSVDWPEARNEPRLAQHHNTFAAWLARAKLGGKALSNPLWRLLPGNLTGLLGGQLGPLITVHPLGGCAMGDHISSGVVNHLGQVFKPKATDQNATGNKSNQTYAGLLVLDGSIVPTSLGINPALTITVLAKRAAEDLALRLGLQDASTQPVKKQTRPIFKRIQTVTKPQPTEVELIERTSGKRSLRNDHGAVEPYGVELTLAFNSKALDELTFEILEDETHAQRKHRRSMTLNPTRSTLRIFRLPQVGNDAAFPDERAPLLEAPLSGTLRLFRPAPTSRLTRTLSASLVWLLNRGARDIAQAAFDRLGGRAESSPIPDPVNIFNLSSRAGGVRLLEYDLKIGKVSKLAVPFKATGHRFCHQKLSTVKRLTYGVPLSIAGLRTLITREGPNPWLQMTQMTVTRMPKARSLRTHPPLLSLELP